MIITKRREKEMGRRKILNLEKMQIWKRIVTREEHSFHSHAPPIHKENKGKPKKYRRNP